MSTFKKLLALTLALAMVLSVSAFAGYTVAPYGDADKVDEDCEVAVQLLYSMNIMKGDDKGNFNPTATITRAEVAKMIYVILNYGKDDKAVNYTGAKLFSDVAAGAWYEGYVNYCGTTKLVQGRGNGTFGPNDPVTTAEAAKMLLTAIGYSAEARGYVGAGWDKQVLSDAAIIGLLDGYNYSTTTYAPRQWVAVMFKNALTDAYTYGTIAPVIFNGLLNGTTLPSGDYKTMGEKYYNMADFEGVITANEYADLYGAETKSAGRTVLDKKLSLKVSSDLTEIGESRWGYYNTKTNEVYYIGDTGDNTEFSTGAGTTIVKKNIDGIKLNADTEYFLNFDASKTVKEEYPTGNGDWLRVVDNDDDGYAEYVFVTEFEMTEVTKVAKDDTVFLANGKDSDEFEMSEEVAAGDVVLYTKIDGVEYVDIADSFTGEVDKYTYKTDVLTVDGEDYGQSAIAIDPNLGYFDTIAKANRKTEYVYFQDHFGFIRAYAIPEGADGEIILLTDAYYETNRNGKVYAVDAYLNGEISDYDVDPAYGSQYAMFINDLNPNANNWDRLIPYADNGAQTNLARYTEEDGVLTLYTAKTSYYDKQGKPAGTKTDYVNLVDEPVKAGQTTYNAYENGKKQYVQVNKETVYYYVSYADGTPVVETVVGYKDSYDVIAETEIKAMYAVCTNIENDSDKDPYWVADVVVVETKYPVFNLNNDVVLGYDIVNKTVKDFASLDVIGADAALDNLSVTNINGYNSFNKEYFTIPAFYFNTENADNESHIREITGNWNTYGIYAVTVDRVNDLDEYIVAKDAARSIFYFDEKTVVYDIDAKSTYNAITTEDSNDDPLELEIGYDYILYTDGEGYVVYAILVEAYNDVTAALYQRIKGAPADALGAAKAAASDSIEEYAASTVGSSWMQANYPGVEVTVDDIKTTVDSLLKEVDEADKQADIDAVLAKYQAELDAAAIKVAQDKTAANAPIP